MSSFKMTTFNKNATMVFIYLVFSSAVLFSIHHFFPESRNDSDTPIKRSGVSVMTDALTGCQYLSALSIGSVTPRMGVDGKQICKK